MKIIVAAFALLFATNANAQIVSGIIGGVIGAEIASSSSKAPSTDTTAFATKEGHSVMVCCTSYRVNYQMCVDIRAAPHLRGETMSPTTFAEKYGWSKVHSVGFIQSRNDCDKLVIEVSK